MDPLKEKWRYKFREFDVRHTLKKISQLQVVQYREGNQHVIVYATPRPPKGGQHRHALYTCILRGWIEDVTQKFGPAKDIQILWCGDEDNPPDPPEVFPEKKMNAYISSHPPDGLRYMESIFGLSPVLWLQYSD